MRRLNTPIPLGDICLAIGARPVVGSETASKADLNDQQLALPISALATLVSAKQADLSFLTDSRYRAAAEHSDAGAVLVAEKNLSNLPANCVGVVVEDAYLAFAKAAQFFERQLAAQDLPGEVTAAVHPSAQIAPDVFLGEQSTVAGGAIILAGAQIGPGAQVGPNVTIGERVIIGARTVISSGVSIYSDVVIGQDCLIHANSVLGSDGFGFARQGEGWAKIPQLGGLRIGDRCEIGSNTSIDRGALDDTVLGNDCVVDNLVQIAHNVEVGDGTAIAGCVGISGSTKIGKRCLIGGGVGFNGHIEIVDEVIISPMVFVTKSIREAGFYSGTFPCMKNDQWERVAAVVKQLPDLRSRLRQLEKLTRNNQ